MKKLLLFSIVFLFIIACGNNAKENKDVTANTDEMTTQPPSNEQAVDTLNAPVVEVEANTYSFGEVKEGEKVKHEYEFTNTGKTPLIISSVRASCGCTTPNYPKQPIKPGEKSKIEVVFDTNGQPGMQHKVITMVSNAHPSQTIFHLKGEVK